MLKILFKLEFFFPNFFANNFQYITIILKKINVFYYCCKFEY